MKTICGIALSTVMLAACAHPAPLPIKDPLRPAATPVAREQPKAAQAVDCPAVKPSEGPDRKTYKERAIEEGVAEAEAGLKLLIAAEDTNMPVPEREKDIAAAMQKFFMSLSADPYNVLATYNLAAAYARIGRNQCALNLLARLAEMSSWPSQKEALEDVANRIYGRGKKWKDKPDPDFDRLRTDEHFREIVKNI